MYPPAEVAACARELSTRADLRQYTTESAAHDIDAVRAVLGYARVDLMGLSYGTILAQAYMKLYPERVRTAALMGTVPLGEQLPLHHAANAEATLHAIFGDCRFDPNCHAAFPRVADDWQAMNLRLRTSSVTVKAGMTSVALQSGPFLETTRSVMNTIFAQRALPRAVHLAAGGNFTPFLALFPKEQSQVIALGLYLSVTCPEGTRRIGPTEAAQETAGTSFGRYRVDEQIAACRQWPAAHANPDLLTPLSSAIPVLLIAGGRDSTAPPAWARKVAATLPNSRVLEIEPLTHLPVGLSHMICMDQIMDAFYARGSAAGLDTSCIATMKPPPFVTRTPA
jgi:pimeloyl-ACP methyl ester carboxylesterase